MTQNLTLTLNLKLKLKLKLNPKSDHTNAVKTTCFGLGNGFVTFLDNKRNVKGTYSAFWFWEVFRGNIKNFCSVVPHP